MNIDLIIKVIIPILGAIITYLIYPFVKANTTEKQREDIEFWVKKGVHAAEQLEKAGKITLPKKIYVVEYIQDKGFDITEDDLNNMIEAIVYELNIEKLKAIK